MTAVSGCDRLVTIAATNVCRPYIYIHIFKVIGSSGFTGLRPETAGAEQSRGGQERWPPLVRGSSPGRFCTAPSSANSKANSVASEKEKKSREKITVLLYFREFRFLSLSLDTLAQGALADKPFFSASLAAFVRVSLFFIVVNIKEKRSLLNN